MRVWDSGHDPLRVPSREVATMPVPTTPTEPRRFWDVRSVCGVARNLRTGVPLNMGRVPVPAPAGPVRLQKCDFAERTQFRTRFRPTIRTQALDSQEEMANAREVSIWVRLGSFHRKLASFLGSWRSPGRSPCRSGLRTGVRPGAACGHGPSACAHASAREIGLRRAGPSCRFTRGAPACDTGGLRRQPVPVQAFEKEVACPRLR